MVLLSIEMVVTSIGWLSLLLHGTQYVSFLESLRTLAGWLAQGESNECVVKIQRSCTDAWAINIWVPSLHKFLDYSLTNQSSDGRVRGAKGLGGGHDSLDVSSQASHLKAPSFDTIIWSLTCVHYLILIKWLVIIHSYLVQICFLDQAPEYIHPI